MPEILLYATKFCPYCRRARALLDSKGVSYKVLDVNQNPALWKEINDRTGRNTVPQIFIGGRHVGGCDDLYDIERRGELAPLLQGA